MNLETQFTSVKFSVVIGGELAHFGRLFLHFSARTHSLPELPEAARRWRMFGVDHRQSEVARNSPNCWKFENATGEQYQARFSPRFGL